MAFKAAPLPHEWMVASIIGFFVSLLLVYGDFGHRGTIMDAAFQKWGVAFMLVFILMFISSLVSMSNATTDPEHLDTLAIHYHKRR